MAAVVNALSHNGHKHGQNDQANDNCWCIHRRPYLAAAATAEMERVFSSYLFLRTRR